MTVGLTNGSEGHEGEVKERKTNLEKIGCFYQVEIQE